ncbi:MAG: FecR domain-containing protein [Saprospiraceae bacterium]
MKYTETIILIHKYISGELNAKQKAEFVTWLNDDKENKKLFDQVTKIWEHAAKPANIEFDAKNAFLKHQNRIEQAELTSQPTKEVIQPKTKIFHLSWIRMAAAVFTLAIVSVIVFKYQSGESNIYRGIDKIAQLEDGTKVYLDEGAVMTVNAINDQQRIVSLQGRAYFEVESNKVSPFKIEARDFNVVVLGTKFIVDASKTLVSVREGKVSVATPKSEKVLVANQNAYIDKSGELRVEDQPFYNNEIWFKGDLIFKNTPFDKVIADISLFFKVKFDFPENRNWSSCTFTSGSLKDNTLDQVLLTLQLTYDLEYIKLDDGSIKLRKVSCR